MMLKNFLEPRPCTSILTDTIGEENTVLKTIVHGALEMSRSDPLYGPERRRLRIEKLRGHQFVSGYHDYDIVKGGVKVFPRLISSEHIRKYSNESVGSGVAELDRLLGGGLDRGTCTLLQGASGTGKSALATQFAVFAAQRNERSMIFCFDERISTFIQRAKGLSMDIETYLADDLITISQVDPAELSAGEFSSIVTESVIEKDISLIIIDSLNGYTYALPDERYLSVHIHELASFLNLQGVVTLFTMSQQSVFGLNIAPSPFNISYVADTVLNMGYFEHQGTVHKAVSVLKRRNGNHEHTIRELTMDSGGLHVGPVLQEFEGIATGNPKYIGSKTKDIRG
jgi:circadian clock protein KaiC